MRKRIPARLIRESIKQFSHIAYLVIEEYVTKKNTTLSKFIEMTDVAHSFMKDKRIQLEVKRTRAKLKHYDKIAPGALLKTLVDLNARHEISLDFFPRGRSWEVIPTGSYVLFLDVEHDRNYDSVVMKLLCDQKILYVYKNSNFNNFNREIGSRFEIISQPTKDNEKRRTNKKT